MNTDTIAAIATGMTPSGIGIIRISGEDDTWDDFIDEGQLEDVKEYIWLRVKLVFDPPASSIVKQAYDDRKNELEWLLREVSEVGY